MKHRLFFLSSLIAIGLSTPTLSADDNSGTSQQPPLERRISLGKIGEKPVGVKPGAPSRQSVECTLSDAGIMVITMRVPEGEAELTVTDGFDTITEWFDTSAPYTTILPDGTATYSVSVTTAQGHTYSGTI